MKKCIRFFVFLLLCFTSVQAETTLESLLKDKGKMGSNYYVYSPVFKKQSKVPSGYKPFYISHYGRHGSRYHHTAKDYQYVYETLQQAQKAGALTTLGESVLVRAEALYKEGKDRAGDLTQKGVAQQQEIAKRMYQNFPALFKGDAFIKAYSSTSGRCIMSMGTFLQELKAQNPRLEIYQESSQRLMSFISPFSFDSSKSYMESKEWKEAYDLLYGEVVHPDLLMKSLFKDSAYVSKNINPHDFLAKMYDLQSSLQGMDHVEFDFSDVMTDEIMLGRYQAQNAWWYGVLGAGPLTYAKGPTFAKPLLKHVLEDADEIIEADTTQNKNEKGSRKATATLRFGHDTALLGLAGLMQLDIARAQVKDLKELYKVWNDFNLISMGANLQMVFYKSAKKGNPILVKFLYNESEVTVPVACAAKNQCPAVPYYRFEDVRNFYNAIISKTAP